MTETISFAKACTRQGPPYDGTALVWFDSNKYSAGFTTAPGDFCRSFRNPSVIFVCFVEWNRDSTGTERKRHTLDWPSLYSLQRDTQGWLNEQSPIAHILAGTPTKRKSEVFYSRRRELAEK